MLELTINNEVYSFNFGMGFMREINKKETVTMAGFNTAKNIGLSYYVAGIIDGDVEALAEVLDVANKGLSPRVTKKDIDEYIDNPNTDIDKLFEEVIYFLKNSNATKKATTAMMEALEMEKNQ